MVHVQFRILVVLLLVMISGREVMAQLPLDTILLPSGFSQQQLNSIIDLEADTSGNIWASFSSIGVLHYDGTSWQNFTKSNTGNMLPTDTVYAMHLEKNGTLWMLTRYGITRKDASGFSFFPTDSSFFLPVSFSSDITVARGQVFISSRVGVFVYDLNADVWQQVRRSNSPLPSDTVNSLYTDPSDNVWVATINGFASWTASGITPYTKSNYSMPFYGSLSIAVTPFDTLIAGYSTVYKWSGNTFINLDSIFSRKFVADEWCDSLSFGLLTTRAVDPFYPGTKLTVTDNSDVYIARYASQEFLMVVKPGNVIRTMPVGSTDFIIQRFSGYKGDSLIYYNYGSNRLSVIPADNSYKYNDPADSLNMVFPSTFEYSIPESFKSNGGQADIAPNMISTRVLNQGDNSWDPVRQVAYYNIPRYSGINSIFNSAIWMGGYDQQGNLYAAAQTYRQNNSNDFYPGPLDTLGRADSATSVVFNNIWVTRRTDVDEFRFQFAKGNVTNGTFPVSQYILNWPAFYNNAAFPQKLAPFIDFNGDGLYNPYDGDYPDVKGEQMSWCVYNDDLVKTQTNSPPMFAEIHASTYGYYCPTAQDALSKLIAYTTFYHHDLYNRSDRTYDSCYFGIWSDMMLGNPSDDYVGCNVTNNTFYVYNSDLLDEGGDGFGWCPPVQNITFLKGPSAPSGDGRDNNHNNVIDEPNEDQGMHSFVFYRNGNDPIGGHPYTKEHYYGYFVPRWLDGSPVTFGGDGLGNGIGATNIPTNYMFPDTTDHNFSTPWTMPGASILPDDMRGVGAAGPFTWPPDSVVSFDVAYITGPNDLAQNHVLVGQLRELFRSGGIEKHRKFSPPMIGEDSVAYAGTIVTYVMPTSADNYIWTVTNGLIVSGQGTNTLEVTWGTAGTGTITAEAFDTGAPCERMQTIDVTIGPPLAAPCDGERTVRLYPNPARSVVQIESVCDTISAIRIWSMSGQLMETRSFNGNYNAAWLSTGVYVMEMLSSTDEALVRKMFVKY